MSLLLFLSQHGLLIGYLIRAEKFGAQLSGRGCGRCLHCLGQRTVIPHWPYHEVEQDKVMRVARLLPANASPRAMARFAICADTPFTKATGLQEHPEFGCMKGCRFQVCNPPFLPFHLCCLPGRACRTNCL